ncbi:phosphonate ABC transporter ATP-binding protein [Salipaludibacillus aurantiacus]|uniref:Phosphonate transport system ATP-binding protein n=1 Tax=Salipaludibacillus aurantiacus TaxID=1601833 RepID=A0A1H9W393_9BACI|nr:phosphonate ABC transporter ATP-binding protein [Salipaludibacillus aurantiacus]SES28249.1 phosphonate transport system ATP-binding protein [Salipaludibacillus aurantiacus]
MISLENVTVTYEKETEPALSDLTLRIEEGEFICVLGRSGAGKSTFIRTINGLQALTKGAVYVSGKEVGQLSEKETRRLRTGMGMIFQHFYLIPRLTVKQNVLTGRLGQKKAYQNLLGLFSEQEIKQADYYLQELGLTSFADRRVEHLSGGQKQRVGIARAMMQEPYILLGDEPVASLDPSISDSIFRLVRTLHEQRHLTTIINVHDVDLAKKYATRILALKKGELIFDGQPSELSDEVYSLIYEEESLNNRAF